MTEEQISKRHIPSELHNINDASNSMCDSCTFYQHWLRNIHESQTPVIIFGSGGDGGNKLILQEKIIKNKSEKKDPFKFLEHLKEVRK